MVFLDKSPNVEFQVYSNFSHFHQSDQIHFQKSLVNENKVLDFYTYAGFMLGYLLSFLEAISDVCFEVVVEKRGSTSLKFTPVGLSSGKMWVERASEHFMNDRIPAI